MNDQTNTPNWFVRITVCVFCIFLTLMVIYNYFLVEPKGELNNGIIILLLLILVLILSESFDNFSIAKLISITREAQKNERKAESLEYQNKELLKQLVTLSSTQSQTQQHTNIYGDYHESISDQKISGQESDKKDKKEQVEKLLAAVQDNIVLADLVKNIESELSAKGLSTNGDSEKVLIKHLAGTQLLLRFEQIHSIIFGSQIFLLKKLHESVGIGKSKDFVFSHIDHVKKMFSEQLSSWGYKEYLDYLYFNNLITDGDDSNIHITNLGVEYLSWMFRNGKSDNKPL